MNVAIFVEHNDCCCVLRLTLFIIGPNLLWFKGKKKKKGR